MELGLDRRVALVVGASRGLGRAIAEALGREGARVALAARSERSLAVVARGIATATTALAVDTGEEEAVAALPGRVEEALGPVEVLVLNTGGPPPGAALDADPGQWLAAYRSLVLAPLLLARACVPGMRERGWGRIVNVASTSVREPIGGLTLSNANRAAAVGLLGTLAREVAADGITVNTVATGRFATERLAELSGSLEAAEEAARSDVPAARLGRPEEYGDLVAFLCSERAAYITGTVIPIDGGLTRSS
ncbi:MAG: SDR family oxidoreductase [Thermoleophilia bacterium]|nr:SDR family oxidoreductase [Thermoleophilia bacterium]GIK78648.1 MAG: oxidoreductase [Actinomycetes bacterium]